VVILIVLNLNCKIFQIIIKKSLAFKIFASLATIFRGA